MSCLLSDYMIIPCLAYEQNSHLRPSASKTDTGLDQVIQALRQDKVQLIIDGANKVAREAKIILALSHLWTQQSFNAEGFIEAYSSFDREHGDEFKFKRYKTNAQEAAAEDLKLLVQGGVLRKGTDAEKDIYVLEDFGRAVILLEQLNRWLYVAVNTHANLEFMSELGSYESTYFPWMQANVSQLLSDIDSSEILEDVRNAFSVTRGKPTIFMPVQMHGKAGFRIHLTKEGDAIMELITQKLQELLKERLTQFIAVHSKQRTEQRLLSSA